MPSNFDFLQTQKPDLFEPARSAEALVHRSPRAACFYARFALETTVHWLYDHDPDLRLPYDRNLSALIHESSFRDNLPGKLFPKIRTILTVGNRAAHERAPLTARDAMHVVKELFHFLYWVSRIYADDASEHPHVAFDRALIPVVDKQDGAAQATIDALQAELDRSTEMARIEQARRDATEAELTALRHEVAALKKRNESLPDDHDYNEEETRIRFVDVLLQEAGWDPAAPNVAEFPVTGMPITARSPNGGGKVDYVLWGDNGLPLAVIETKRARSAAEKGKRQAELYADALQGMYGQRPVIFYTNGYEHYLWDDAGGYPPRAIQGFLRKEELERMIHRRANAAPLAQVTVNTAIVGRSYQTEAIRRVTEGLERRERRHLLVMATGTGKTRTAIALVDLLKRAGWVKRVLFLADRNALLIQARRAFKEHLPSATAVDITEDRSGTHATVVLSTYPTMMNRIDDLDGGDRPFGVGHFDLIVIDEAHRSVYQKYRAIFEYFDALLLGLTATPRDEVHRDTYRLFELEKGVPTYAYELERAVAEGYLVPPSGISAPFRFLQEGVTYDKLTDAEKELYDETFTDLESGERPDHISAAALNKWLFNEDTVDQALQLLMERGLKVDAGTRLGKTIIFARNHDHAMFIVERFDWAFPNLAGKFAQVIDSRVDYAQTTLDAFSERDQPPHIAVSVDMLDTGVDVPEVLNLVFFKPVRSRVKFNQMIGRGTRLCPDLLGPGQDKTEFLIFDLCSNFGYFGELMKEPQPQPRESLDTQLVRSRLEVVHMLDAQLASDAPPPQLRADLLDALHRHVQTMNPDSFMVRKHRALVEVFAERARWDALTADDAEAIVEHLAPLPNGLDPEHFESKRFDVLCYRTMIASQSADPSFIGLRDRIRDIADQLEQLDNVPTVHQQRELIEAVQDEAFWQDVTLPMLDDLRRRLRGLVPFIEKGRTKPVYTDFEDEPMLVVDAPVPTYQPGFSPLQYRKKVEAYVREHESHVAIAKVKRGRPLTAQDLESLEALLFNAETLGTREQFEETYGAEVSLARFIRRLVGLDRNAAMALFGSYLDGVPFNATQVHFVETLIDYLTRNGVMDPGLLYEPPFSDLHHEGLDGVFGHEEAESIVRFVQDLNASAGAQFGAQAAGGG